VSLAADDLLALATAMVDIPSASHEEERFVDALQGELDKVPWLEVDRVGCNLVARTHLGRPHRLILAGHTDTVPAQGNNRARLDGDCLWGLGACDMKGALAVFLRLARRLSQPLLDVTYVFYAREEVADIYSGLEELFRARPELLVGDAAILGEPTAVMVEAGCQGTLRLKLTLRGQRAHTARPWMGRNAIHRLGAVLSEVAAFEPRRPVVAGLQFREALQAVSVDGGVAGNVVPDEARLVLNVRFAPDRDGAEAAQQVRELLEPYLEADDRLELVDRAEGAYPAVAHPLLSPLVERFGLAVNPKLGWTDVARFAQRGVPAVNFGPGDPTLAHSADEHVLRIDLLRVYEVLEKLLMEPVKADATP
jgi:succinyl-diaminopimelate desuccinylase